MIGEKECFLLPLKDMVLFPNSTTTILVGRAKSLLSIEKAYINNEKIFCVAQKNKDIDDITNVEQLFEVGIFCKIIQKINMPNGEIRLIISCQETGRIIRILENENCYRCIVKNIRESRIKDDEEEIKKVKKIVISKFEDFLSFHVNNSDNFIPILKSIENNIDIIYILTNLLNINIQAKQNILEEKSVLKKFIKLNQYLEIEKDLINTEKEINGKVDKKIQDLQKKYYLKEKLKAIKNELKDEDIDEETNDEIKQLKKKFFALKVDTYVKEKFDMEIKKLSIVANFSPEYSTVKNYLDLLVGLPWNKNDKIKNDIKKAETILNKYHYGLDDIKERILDYIAVFEKTKKVNGSIICLVGAPGVGKTSLAKSIAEATNRKYVKVSLGGVRDEAEIRGHRKTYVGAMPGKIIQSINKVQTSNPLILLDEIDKMSSDFRGDPTSAMLEVLDPEQNKSFNDHYLEVEYDLSNVMFIATANSLQNIPVPLRDRMEIIHLSGYTEDEKLNITKNYLIKKELEKHGLKADEINISDDVITKIIRNYTFEAGVRNLERSIETLVRKSTRKLVENKMLKCIDITIDNLKDFLGIEKNTYNTANKEDKVGVSTGLAYTEFGGDLLYLEALKFDGNGKLNITGKLGDVMKESATAAFSYVRSKASDMGITSKVFNKYDFHLHVPEGATPKDGPSAGVAISATLMSALTSLKIRSDTAMTGEITLTGNVLPIGGLKEKLLAALRGNIKNVLIPKDNVRDLEKIPDNVKKNINIIPIEKIDEAFNFLLIGYKNNV